jgi:ABC-2 type transport system ATP-binding protein
MSGLQEHRRSRTGSLSTGWKQRLSLGCAILHEPPVIFLDEPTSGVDPISRRNFWNLIHQMAQQGITVFVTTHYMEEAEYCDRLALIYRGELAATGTPQELKSNLMTREVLELKSEHPQDLIEPLEKVEGVKDVALFGRGLHLVVDDYRQVQPALYQALRNLKISEKNLRPITPSLEDVFVSLIEEREMREQPQQAVRR